MKIHNCEQQSDEWFLLHDLKFTGSEATAIANNGKGLETLVTKLMAQHLSSGVTTSFSTRHTERGNELEPFARELYELENGVTVEKVGFIEKSKYVGCSPDGLVGKDGGVEIKSPDDIAYYVIMRDKENAIDSTYKWQVQYNLWVTKRKWWDLVFYNPNFSPSLMVFKVLPDKEAFKKFEEGVKKGTELIEAQLALFKK